MINNYWGVVCVLGVETLPPFCVWLFQAYILETKLALFKISIKD
jgi:hypothetical protein